MYCYFFKKIEKIEKNKKFEEIKLLEEEFAGDAPLNVLISNMSEKYGVSEDKTEQIVRNLVQKGVIYQPTTGYFRIA